jgi:hypothetical protein
MMRIPPTMAAGVSGEFSGGGRSWSTIATMKMVRSAATDDRTGEVREIRTRKDPEKAGYSSSAFGTRGLERNELTSICQHGNGHHAGLFSPR